MMRAVLVDDEAPARARLTALLVELGGVSIVGEAGDAAAARTVIAAQAPDVVFLDIEMPAERGTDLAASLPEPRPFIVFATAYERFAVDAFQYDAADYLLKPVTRQRLQATIDRLRQKLAARHDASRELSDAVRAQSFLLPRAMPSPPGFAVGARTLPARAVGGDFYDAEMVDGRMAFVLGDVSGKGMAAGLIASSVQARWQAAIRQRDLSLAGMMTSLNRDVMASTEGSRYATLLHGVLAPDSGEIRYVNAGHPPSVVVAADGRWTQALASTAPAVGLMDVTEFPAATYRLQLGETLIVMSDGVSEARDARGDDLDLAGLGTLAARCPGADVTTLADDIVSAVRRHRGADQGQDDVTVFILRRMA
ncbi:MAG TPA: SpoIIE family protein phosphatase [Vicinamibacterales bacterium]|nr:SpoIIE family protein phosphatase [Vicinamibacterales bacterium]